MILSLLFLLRFVCCVSLFKPGGWDFFIKINVHYLQVLAKVLKPVLVVTFLRWLTDRNAV